MCGELINDLFIIGIKIGLMGLFVGMGDLIIWVVVMLLLIVIFILFVVNGSVMGGIILLIFYLVIILVISYGMVYKGYMLGCDLIIGLL